MTGQAVMPLPAYNVVYDADQGTGGGWTDTTTNTIHLVPGSDRFALGHELGHLADAQFLTDADRHYFQRILHAPKGPWMDERTGEAYPQGDAAEWFADYYAAAVTHFHPSRRESGTIRTNDEASYATIGPRRLARFKAALDRVRRRRHAPAFHW